MENAPQQPPKRGRGRPRIHPKREPEELAPGAEAEAASILGSRGLGKPKRLTPEERERRAEHARSMTRRRIAIRGIVVEGSAPPSKPGRARVQGAPGQE